RAVVDEPGALDPRAALAHHVGGVEDLAPPPLVRGAQLDAAPLHERRGAGLGETGGGCPGELVHRRAHRRIEREPAAKTRRFPSRTWPTGSRSATVGSP